MIEQEGLFDPPSFVGFRLSTGGQAGGFTIIRPVRPDVFQKYGFVLGRDQRREGGGSCFMIALFSHLSQCDFLSYFALIDNK